MSWFSQPLTQSAFGLPLDLDDIRVGTTGLMNGEANTNIDLTCPRGTLVSLALSLFFNDHFSQGLEGPQVFFTHF